MEQRSSRMRSPHLIPIAAALACAALLATTAKSAEIIPAVGLTRAAESDDAEFFGSLAFRGDLASVLQSEIGIAYRSESRFDDRLHLRMWPVTASLWLVPVPSLYAGAGVGFYQVTYDYDQDEILFDVEDETKQEFGVHVGGGLRYRSGPRLLSI